MKFQGSLVPESATNHENLTMKFLSYNNLYILTALCLYIILLWCSILTLVRIDASNAMIKSIGNERRHQLLLRESKIISNTTDVNEINKQDEYLNPSIAASVEHKGNTANGTLDTVVRKSFNESNKITQVNAPFNEQLNNYSLRYYADKIGKIINQTIKSAETMKFLHDSFYKNPLHLGNNMELNNTELNNTVKTVGIENIEKDSEQSPLLEIIEMSKNELLEPIAESDQSHILSLIKTKKGGKTKPKNVQITTGKSLVNKTDVPLENDNSTLIKNTTSNEVGSNFTLRNTDLTSETAKIQETISLQSNASDSVIKYLSQSNKSEVSQIKQNKTYNKNINIDNDTSINKNIHSEDSKYTSAKPTNVTLDNRNYTTPGNIQIEDETTKIFIGTVTVKNNTLDKNNFDTSTKPFIDNYDIDVNVAGDNENAEIGSFDVHNYNSDTIVASTTPVPGITKTDVKAVISSKYDPAWRNKSLSAIGIKIGNKSAKQTILYSKHVPTNLTVFSEKPKETNNKFKIPSLRERLGQLSKKRYRLRKVTTNQTNHNTTQTTTSSPLTTPSSTYTTSSAAWILYNGTHRLQDDLQNTEPRMDSEVTANQKLFQGLSSSHIEFLYDFDRIPTPAPLINADQSFYSNIENVGIPEQVMNGHQSNFAEKMHIDLFQSVPKVRMDKPFKPVCEHKNIELFAEYDDNIGQYSSRNGEIRREKRDTQRVKSLTEFESLIMNLTMLLSNGQNDTETNEEDSDDLWNYNSELVLPNFTLAVETTTGKSFGPPTEVTSEASELTFEDILNSKLSQNDTVAIVNLPTMPQVNSSTVVQQKLKSKRKPYILPRKSKPSKLEHKFTNSLNKTEGNNRNQSSVLTRHSLAEKRTTIPPGRKKIVQKNMYKLQKLKLITPEAVEITVESKGHTTQDSQTAQNITTDLAKLMMVLMSKTEDLD